VRHPATKGGHYATVHGRAAFAWHYAGTACGCGGTRKICDRRETQRGKPVRYLRSTFLPSEEKTFCLFDAPSAERVKEANELAQIPLQRIVEVKHIAAEDVG
jgi:hypothetical protein